MKATRRLLLGLTAAAALSATANTGTVTTSDGLVVTYDTDLRYASITGYESDAKNVTLDLPSSVVCEGIPLPVLSIGAEAFKDASELKGVAIPSSVLTIGTDAFTASGLKALHIPATVQTMGGLDGGIAIDCPDLVSFTMDPKSEVTILYAYECRNCPSLTHAVIGENVTKVDYAAFSKCDALTLVDCYAALPPELGSGVFRGMVKSEATLKVPRESIEKYTESGWYDLFGTVGALDTTPGGGDDDPENPGEGDDPENPGTVNPAEVETVKVKISNSLTGCAYTVDAVKGLPYVVEFELPAGTVINAVKINGFDDSEGLMGNVYTSPCLESNTMITVDMEKTTSLTVAPYSDADFRVCSDRGVVTISGLSGGEEVLAVATDGRTLARLTASGSSVEMALPVGEAAVISVGTKAVTIIP